MTSRRAVLGLALVCHGCTKPATPPSVEPVPPIGAGVDATPPAAGSDGAAASTGPRFWVANGGLQAYDPDGKPVANLGDFGDWAIRLSDGRVVALREGGERLQLALVNAAGERGAAIELPTVFDDASCQPRVLRADELEEASAADDWEAFPVTLGLQSTRDFQISRGETFACLTLMDRNENMSDYDVSVAVNLSTGAVSAALTFSIEEACEQAEVHPACASYEATRTWIEAPAVEAPTWPLRYEQGFVVDEAGTQVADLCPPGARDDPEFDPGWLCPELELESSSARWLLLTGNISEGDYIHRESVLLDRASGELWRVVQFFGDDAGYRWIAAQASDVFASLGDDGEGGYPLDLVGESQVEALPEDRFWIDGRLLIPERQLVVELGGTLADQVTLD